MQIDSMLKSIVNYSLQEEREKKEKRKENQSRNWNYCMLTIRLGTEHGGKEEDEEERARSLREKRVASVNPPALPPFCTDTTRNKREHTQRDHLHTHIHGTTRE